MPTRRRTAPAWRESRKPSTDSEMSVNSFSHCGVPLTGGDSQFRRRPED
jgi:hypothetical protein